MYKVFLFAIKRELLITYRSLNDFLMPFSFFLLLSIFFPIIINTDSLVLKKIAHGILWLAYLFSCFLSINRLFDEDYQSGFFELISKSKFLVAFVIGKLFCGWLLITMPIILVSPITLYIYGINETDIILLFFSMLIGTPIIFNICFMVASLTFNLKASAILAPVLIFPLIIPVLILVTSFFGEDSFNSMHPFDFFKLLFLLSIITTPFTIFASYNSIKNSC